MKKEVNFFFNWLNDLDGLWDTFYKEHFLENNFKVAAKKCEVFFRLNAFFNKDAFSFMEKLYIYFFVFSKLNNDFIFSYEFSSFIERF